MSYLDCNEILILRINRASIELKGYIHITVCIELRIGRFLEAERTTQDGGSFNTAKVGVSLYLTL